MTTITTEEIKQLLVRLEDAVEYLVSKKIESSDYRAGFLAAIDSVKEALQ